MKLKKWEPWEEEILKENWNIPMRELLVYLPDRTRKTIYWKLSTLGFNRQTYERYTADEDRYIKDNCQLKGNYEIGKHLKRTAKSIAKRMIVLGIKRTDANLKIMKGKNRGCFKPGKKSEKEIPNGYLRLNYDERIDRSFYDIKIGKKFVRLSRYLYENFNNEKLKPSDIVFHADGDSMNLLKENLIKISRSELLSKNNMNDVAFVKRIFRINDPEIIEKIIKEIPGLINQKKQTILLTQKIKKEYAK